MPSGKGLNEFRMLDSRSIEKSVGIDNHLPRSRVGDCVPGEELLLRNRNIQIKDELIRWINPQLY
jgi:hypothetical protein